MGHDSVLAERVAYPILPVQSAVARSVDDRLGVILATGGPFADAYRHLLSTPGKRLRAGLLLACAELGEPAEFPAPSARRVPSADTLDLACAVELLHEASLVHDDICDSSAVRRGAPSVAAKYGVRFAAMAGLHLAGVALRLLADVLERHPDVLARVVAAPREATYTHRMGELSFGQIVEGLPPSVDDAQLRRHYRTVVVAKTGTLFRVACSYGGAVAGCNHDQLRALMAYADHLAVAFQIMDDVRDVVGAPSLGKQAGTDLDGWIPTWPVIEWLALRPGARDLWLAVGEKWLPRPQLASLCSDVVASGATGRAELVAASEVRAACEALAAFPDTGGRRRLAELCSRVVAR